jgi:hypothetical protein
VPLSQCVDVVTFLTFQEVHFAPIFRVTWRGDHLQTPVAHGCLMHMVVILITVLCTMSLLAQAWHLPLPFLSHKSVGLKTYVTLTLTLATHLDLEDGGKMYLSYVGSTVCIYRMDKLKFRSNISSTCLQYCGVLPCDTMQVIANILLFPSDVGSQPSDYILSYPSCEVV